MRLLFLTLLLPAAALAGTGFDGTWKTNMASLKTTGEPFVLLLAGGEYTCSSCNPPYTVKADGAEHEVIGQAYFDIAKVKVTGPNSADIVLKKGSKELVRFSDTVSADGTMLTSKVTNHVGAQTVTDELTAKRVAAAPADSHPLSGSWVEQQHVAGDLRSVQYRMTSERFQMRWNGQSYDAKFDGREYPVAGDPGKTTVSLKKIDDTTVEETDHRQGKVVDEIRLTLANDGNTITVIDKDIAHGQTVTYDENSIQVLLVHVFQTRNDEHEIPILDDRHVLDLGQSALARQGLKHLVGAHATLAGIADLKVSLVGRDLRA